MSDAPVLEALRAFHRELTAVAQHRITDLGPLEAAMLAHTDMFRRLVDKNPRRAESRKALESGTVTIDGAPYAVNKEFQEYALQLADELDLDEIETAGLLFDAEDDQVTLGRPLLECGLIRFHQQRRFLLDCMRLCIQLADDQELDPELQAYFGTYVAENVFRVPLPGQPATKGPRIVPRCMAAMRDIRLWLQKLTDRATAASVLQESRAPEVQEMFEFSRSSLVQQHESLAMILFGAVEKRHVEAKDFEEFLGLLQKWDRYDSLLVHLFPVLALHIRVFGSPDGVCDLKEARRLNGVVCKRDDDAWQIASLRAAITAWWIAEYSGWYMDDLDIPLDNIDIDKEDNERADAFSECLKEGALDFILAVSSDVEAKDWQDPVSSGVQYWIQRKCPPLPTDAVPFSDFFRTCVLEQLENFVDAFISNLPDIIRQLRVEEDEQRQLSQTHEQSLELERFLLIIAHAYEGRPDAAEAFWSDPESNLSGFMQWASHRASTPLVSAFCEMLRAISGNEASADAAHAFLLDEMNTNTSSGRIRKTQSLTWAQVLKELDFFTIRIRDHAHQAPAITYRDAKPVDDQEEAEPESAIMLECYLRLLARISSNSPAARHWLLHSKDFSAVDLLFSLASLPIPSSLRACIFMTLRALLTDKPLQDSFVMWTCFDNFVSGVYLTHGMQPGLVSHAAPAHYMHGVLAEVSQGFEQPYAFVQFLLSLCAPAADQTSLNDGIPFPENLGSTHRMPGIDPYVDFVMETVLAKQTKAARGMSGQQHQQQGQHQQQQQQHQQLQQLQQLQQQHQQQNHQQQQALRLCALSFALTCLETFNEDLILLANETTLPVDNIIGTTDLATYVKLHPFARVMEWIYNHDVAEAIFGAIHEDPAEIGNAPPDAPLILGIIRAVELITKILDLQDTYLDLVRQVIRVKFGERSKPVSTTYSFFEEAIASHLDLVVDLGSFCGLGHPALTLACLKLLEKISMSPKVISSWNPGPGRHAHRNKAIVALEKDDGAGTIAGAFVAEMVFPLDFGLEAEAPNYSIKTYILDFLYSCLQASPDKPSIAHLLLGFQCGVDTLSVESGGAFDNRTSLFHNLLRVLLEAPFGENERGMRQWLILLKHKIMRIFQVLWRSRLSAPIVLADLRENDFAFHLLIREVTLNQDMPWDGLSAADPSFPESPASEGLIAFWALRAMMLEYVCIELCSVSQNRLPSLKRRLFDALNGKVVDDNNEPVDIPTVFDLYDFLSSTSSTDTWNLPAPALAFLRDLDLRAALDELPGGGDVLYDVDKAREIVLLKVSEIMETAPLESEKAADDLRAELQREEDMLLSYLGFLNRKRQLTDNLQSVLQSWAKLLLVMFEANEFRGAAQVSFLLQALQAILPGLEASSTENLDQAYELAKLAEALLYKLYAGGANGDDGSSKEAIGGGDDDWNGASLLGHRNHNRDEDGGSSGGGGGGRHQISSLVSDKLFQLFHMCLVTTCRRVEGPALRATLYNICYRYVAGILDPGSRGFQPEGWQKANKAVSVCGERMLNVVCDDAYGSASPACQTAALVLLGVLVRLGAAVAAAAAAATMGPAAAMSAEHPPLWVVETLHRLNFVGVLVDSLRTALQGGGGTPSADLSIGTGTGARLDQRVALDAKLALLLRLCQTRAGAQYTLQANLFRVVEQSGLFAADPELQQMTTTTTTTTTTKDSSTLAQHYGLLGQVARVLGAAVVSRGGSHNLAQARRFLGAHRMLVLHVLKRSAGIGVGATGTAAAARGVDERVADLAEALMVLMVATDFLEFEDEQPAQPQTNPTRVLFH